MQHYLKEGDTLKENTYEIYSENYILGTGGFAIVYKAKNTKNNRLVAIKEIKITRFEDDFVRTMLKREILILVEIIRKKYEKCD